MEPKKDVVEKGRSVRDMHHLRLMSLLQELERDNGRKKAAEVLGVDRRTLDASLDEGVTVGSGVTLGKDVSGRQTVDLPYLRVANVQDGHINLATVKTVRVPVDEVNRFRLEAGDILMTRGWRHRQARAWHNLGRGDSRLPAPEPYFSHSTEPCSPGAGFLRHGRRVRYREALLRSRG